MSEKAARREVCLVSSHRIVLEELSRTLPTGRFRVRVAQLDFQVSWSLPKQFCSAQIYVVDACYPLAITEAVIAEIQARVPAAAILVIGEHIPESFAFSLLKAGVKGLMSYDGATEELLRAMPVVLAGDLWVPRRILVRFVDSLLCNRRRRLSHVNRVTSREREVLEAVLDNLSNKEIAGRLHISERTVKFHVSNLLAKFGVENRRGLLLQSL